MRRLIHYFVSSKNWFDDRYRARLNTMNRLPSNMKASEYQAPTLVSSVDTVSDDDQVETQQVVSKASVESEFSAVMPTNTDSLCLQSGEVSNVGGTIPDQSSNDSSTVKPNTEEDDLGRSGKHPFRKYIEDKLAKNYYSLSYPTPTQYEDLRDRRIYHDVVEEKKFQYEAFLAFGLSNFMSYAAHFCKYEARNGAEIVSVGSGDGSVDREIIATYRKHFGQQIKITLIDPNPEYEVDFKTVDDLIKERPNVVRNCLVFIIWPEPMGRNDGYDIEAIRKLQPLAVLTVYEPTEVSGSAEFNAFLYRQTQEKLSAAYDYCDPDHKFGLDNYKVEDVVRQEVYLRAGEESEMFGQKWRTDPATRVYSMRMVRLKRTD